MLLVNASSISFLGISVSCSNNQIEREPLIIDGKSDVFVGKKEQYILKNDITHKTIKPKWSSTDPKIVSIDDNGQLIAHKEGTATIVAEVPNFSPIYKKINIYNEMPERIEIEGPSQIDPYVETTYTARVYPDTAQQTVIWSVNESFATITDDGKLTVDNPDGVKLEITATSSVLSYVTIKKTIKVNYLKPNTIKINGKKTVCLNDHEKYEIQVEPEKASKSVVWTVSDGTIAYISSDGTLTPLKAGNVQIQAMAIGDRTVVSEPFDIKIIDGDRPKMIQIVGSHWVPLNTEIQYKIRSIPDKTSTEVKWSIVYPNNSNEVSITEDGRLTATAECSFMVKAVSIADDTIVDSMVVTAKQAQDLVSCKFNPTIGHAYDVFYDEYIPVGERFKIRFESTRYGKDKDSICIHNQIKKDDLEINSEQSSTILSSSTLENNVLTTPIMGKDENIIINILGGEISDACTWPLISNISVEDDASPERNVAEKYFQVGDYKKVIYRKLPEKEEDPLPPWEVAAFRIIDFHHDDCWGTTPEGESVRIKTAFTFYSETVNYNNRWDYWNGYYENDFYFPPWEGEDGRYPLVQLEIIDLIECFDFVPRKVQKASKTYGTNVDNSLFFVLNKIELGYETDDSPNKPSLYSYFDETKYHSNKSVIERRKCPGISSNGYWLNSYSITTLGGIQHERHFSNCYWANEDATEATSPLDFEPSWPYNGHEAVEEERSLILAFCL